MSRKTVTAFGLLQTVVDAAAPLDAAKLQLAFASRRERILVTFNRDDFERLHERMIRSKQSHFGILYSEVINSSELIDRLRKFLDDASITTQQMKNEIRDLGDWK